MSAIDGSSPAPGAFVELRALRKRFGAHDVLRDFSLDIAKGEIVALLGVSGSGKTTALRLLAGLDAADGGLVRIAGDDVTALPAARRGVGMVFQHYALFPHLSIGENVSFGLEGRGLPRDEIRRRAEATLAQVRLEGHFDARVGALSGGMQQRVAIARALAPAPRVLLLDEPFSNLDPVLREHTRGELRETIQRIGITTVLVTHEQEEAFDVADRVALLLGGQLEQVGTAEDLYSRPRSLRVASFIGRSSRLDGTGVPLAAGLGVRLAGAESCVWPGEPAPGASTAALAGQPATLVLRPEALRFAEAGPPALDGRVEARRFAGSWSYYRVRLDLGPVVEVLASAGAVSVGQAVAVTLAESGQPALIFASAGAPVP